MDGPGDYHTKWSKSEIESKYHTVCGQWWWGGQRALCSWAPFNIDGLQPTTPAGSLFRPRAPCGPTSSSLWRFTHSGGPAVGQPGCRHVPSGQGLTKLGPLEKGMANHFSILALRIPWVVWKGKKIWHWKMDSPGRQVPNILLGKSREITTERMKRLSQSGNHTQLWLCLVVKVRSDAVKSNIAQEPGMWGPRIKVNWM